jgi:deoxyribodipyrimidine photo-lyase
VPNLKLLTYAFEFSAIRKYFLWCDQGENLPENIVNRNKNFQQGEHLAWRYLDSFVKERYVNYSKHISKPALSRKGCSRLSPYLTYGNISMRMIYQYTNQNSKTNVRFSILYLDFTGIAILYKIWRWMSNGIWKCRAYDTLVKPKMKFT